jgi:hypothetical protein
MTSSITIKLAGFDELAKQFRAMPQEFQTHLIRAAVAEGAAVVRLRAVEEAPLYQGVVQRGHPPPGTLKTAVYQVRVPEECSEVLEVFKVSVHKGKRFRAGDGGNRDGYYASWIEFGHWARISTSFGHLYKTRKTAREAGATSPRWISPNPFMRRAYEGAKEAAVVAMHKYLTLNVNEVWKRIK